MQEKHNLSDKPSLCWDCKEAKALKCFSKPFIERTYIKDYIIIKIKESDGHFTERYRVKKCDNFVHDLQKEEIKC